MARISRDVPSNLHLLMLGISRGHTRARDARDFLRGVVRRKEPLSALAVNALKMEDREVSLVISTFLHVTTDTLLKRIDEIIANGDDEQISRLMILRVLETDTVREEFKLKIRQHKNT
jgi:hypothetical protein